MASINKLSIRGVRSFSPDDAEQVLEFYFPCTIIVGANGCGKTTIIESLKFAVCGAMPPGNKSGQAFVHDPRSLGQNVVKANVKLRFTGRAGNSMVVVRSMEVQQKKTTMTFKQLDGVLRSADKDGNRISMGHKCTELDRQLPLLLGVSKAILEHVVFCHQEDASWPLQEGAVLKKRFDDIFDSTRYSKALEVFSRLKKEYMAKVKDLKVDVAGISSHRFAAKGFRQELDKYNEQMEQVEEEITEQKDALKETEEEQKRLDTIMEQIDDLNTELESRKNEYTTQRQVFKKQSSMLQENLTQQHSVSELKEMLRDFDAQRTQQLEQKADIEAEVQGARKELVRIERQDKELESRVGRLQEKKEMHEQRLRDRFDKMVEMGETFALGDALSAITQTQQHNNTQTQNTSYSTNTSVLDVSVAPHNQEPILDIPEKDMEEFYRAAGRKEEELIQAVEDHKASHNKADSELANQLSDIKAKMTSIETSRSQLSKKQLEARDELKVIGSQLQRTTRVGTSDLEDARQHTARYAKERDQANSDPRKSEIPLEIRDLETKMDAIKRDLEDDRLALDQLRQSTDTQNAVAVLRGQIVKDLESLEETIKDSAYLAQSFNISSFPKEVPGMEEMGKHGEELRDTIEKVVDEVASKYEARNLELERANTEVAKLQQGVSERRALLSHDQRSVNAKRARMTQLDAPDGSIAIVKEVVEELKAYEMEIKAPTPANAPNEARPQELLAYLNKRLTDEESESTEGIQSAVLYKVFKRLIKTTKAKDGEYSCPCCLRDLTTQDEFTIMKKQLRMLSSDQSPLLEPDEQNETSQSKYRRWKDIVAEHSQEILEYRRIANEVNDLETNIAALEDGLSESTSQLNDAKESASDIETQVASLRELLDSSKRWAEAASRIAEKRMQVNQKEIDLTISTGIDTKGRDLAAVERDMHDRQEEREKYTNKMNRLNKEFSALMQRINAVTNLATETEKTFRAKEAKMAEDQKNIQRKHELGEVVAACAADERRLQDELAPLAQRRKSKETEISRLKALASEDEERLRSTKESFIGALKELKAIGRQIEEYQSSTAEDELANVERKKAEFAAKTKEKNSQLKALQPQLDRILKAVEDQERHKKNLKENIELINSTQLIEQLKKEIAKLEEKAATVEGHETVYDDIESLRARKEEILKAAARLEGRRAEILESVRSIKRKLSAPEYKEVDEEYRVAMIKYETTQMAVKDLEKYHSALDKALLKFHSIKIAEINKIILDLWNLTYKGEDITGIQIVSSQESGSRATKSYNYRVVMTKGSTEMDMRGRCSAGQRVLASIVIRLALAETFCLNFGCIALDEPTVNLDYNNKKGLAIALAQIVASRAQQSNFQLIMITHDEDFVSMMKTELSAQSGFQMPEKYFQVRREEGADGKFYSKIDAVDWEELI